MSIQALYDSVVMPLHGNYSTNPNLTEGANIPNQLFEKIIPGYGPIHNFILMTFGIDITVLVTLFATIWTMSKLGNYVFMMCWTFVATNYTSSITISSYDDIYDHLMQWLAEQPTMKASRSLMAETASKSAWEEDDEEYEEKHSDESGLEQIYLNFSNKEAKAPPRFIPNFGTHRFWHKGNIFTLHRIKNTYMEQNSTTYVDREDLTLSCYGTTPQPIKNLLQEAKDFYNLDNNAKTVIRRPAPKEQRRWGGRSIWTQVSHRPCRPMETVVLDARRKAELLRDINEYLHPATPRWYANRGIPYRRGYLFHGPPGTGKTSLSFALAGVFGLDIYVISLLEPTLTEEDLGQLFNSLPRRCVVLLEDIDTAGLVRTDDEKESSAKQPAKEAGSDQKNGEERVESFKISDLAKAIHKANHLTEEDKKKGISLSGLLNAIDGVASHEGRVLVMTTNKPEKLDDALIRPGRVDLQVGFTNATQPQIKELFQRMYTSDKPNPRKSKLRTLPKPKVNILTPPDTPVLQKAFNILISAGSGLPERSLDEIAEDFAVKIPDDKFSPAEIQGFLLKRKKNPQKACAEVERWVESMVDLKASKTKVLDVQ